MTYLFLYYLSVVWISLQPKVCMNQTFYIVRLILDKPSFLQIAPVEGLEPPTSRLTIADSYQLNYTGITIQIYKFLKYL